MKTDDLINALAADARSVEAPIGRTVTIAAAAGAAVAAALFLSTLGMRHDFAEVASSSGRFLMKFVVTLGAAIPAFLLVRALSRPDFSAGRHAWWLALAPLLLLAAVLYELMMVPSGEWHARMMGHNSLACMTIIPLLSLAPFAAILYALRSGATAEPALAGAIGGILSAGIAATLYASHCTDDSPLFVALWYPFGFIVMAGLGALIGARVLRW